MRSQTASISILNERNRDLELEKEQLEQTVLVSPAPYQCVAPRSILKVWLITCLSTKQGLYSYAKRMEQKNHDMEVAK